MSRHPVPHVVVIDGQGGKMGAQLVAQIKQKLPSSQVTAIGTNAMATAAMIKAGADQAATGENATLVASRTADVIVGPVGIVIADALLGEITPAMATAVGQSQAEKILLPTSRCGNHIVGVDAKPMGELIGQAVETLLAVL